MFHLSVAKNNQTGKTQKGEACYKCKSQSPQSLLFYPSTWVKHINQLCHSAFSSCYKCITGGKLWSRTHFPPTRVSTALYTRKFSPGHSLQTHVNIWLLQHQVKQLYWKLLELPLYQNLFPERPEKLTIQHLPHLKAFTQLSWIALGGNVWNLWQNICVPPQKAEERST